ncbi:hypothetical protein ACFE04_026408 [Oxalis oulophora]
MKPESKKTRSTVMKPESKKTRSIDKSLVNDNDTELCNDFNKLAVSNSLLATNNNNETSLRYDFSKLSEALDGVKECNSCYDFTEINDALDDVKRISNTSVKLKARHIIPFKSRPPQKLPLIHVQYPELEKWDDIVRQKLEQNKRKSMYPIFFRLSTIVEIGASRGKSLRSSFK